MSVVLKGMKLPEGNPRTINIYRDGSWVDAYTTEDGKAIELPPHGRLIDAESFDERVRVAGGMSEEELTDDFKDGVQTTLYMLQKHPTVIPAEEET